MPTPQQLTQWPETLVKLYQQVEDDIIADMAKRINAQNYFIPAAQWQFQKLQEMGLARKEIYNRLAIATGKTKQHLGWMMRKAGNETIKSGQARASWVDAGELKMTKGLKTILEAGVESTAGLFENITRTTANTASRQLENVLDRAWLQVKSGAFSPQEAEQMAIKNLSRTGVASVRYPSGHTDSLDTVVRRAVRTGVNQTTIKVTLAQAAELGTDLVEATAHSGARPEHAAWQGKVFSISGTHTAYPELRQGTGYGTGAGLGGWNCRHSVNLFFEGQDHTYTREELDDLNAPKYEYNDKKLTQYEAEQQQRYNERQIRRWKRENVAMEAVGQDTSESAVRLSQWQQEQNRFLKQTGLKRRGELEQVVNSGRDNTAQVLVGRRQTEKLQEAGTEPILVVPEAVDRVGQVESGIVPPGVLQEWHRDLLREVQKYPLDTEVMRSYAMSGQLLLQREGEGGTVRIKVLPERFFAIHNHPDTNTFSIGDIEALSRIESLIGLSAVGNNGSVFLLEKLDNFDGQALLTACGEWKKLFATKPQTVHSAVTELTHFLKGVDRFGLKYISSVAGA